MAEKVILYSFADVDRSGKVRWTAAELGLEVEEARIQPPQHREPPYTDVNPYGHVPTAVFRDQTLMESTAICWALVDAISAPALVIQAGQPERQQFLFWMSLFTESFEGRLVECAVSRAGLLGPEYFELHERSLRRKLGIAAGQLPQEGYLCGGTFTLADICAGYSLRLALQCDLVGSESVAPYLDRLRQRPAAVRSRIFESL